VEIDNATAEQRRRARLGSDSPACAVCGEADTRVLELHHLAGRANDEVLATVCRNCHRKLSDPAANVRTPADPPAMERAGRLLHGLAALLELLAATLRTYAAELLAGAAVCPRPYGWATAEASS
jgi:hypothetical protein